MCAVCTLHRMCNLSKMGGGRGREREGGGGRGRAGVYYYGGVGDKCVPTRKEVLKKNTVKIYKTSGTKNVQRIISGDTVER
jgi:hypothetical protein